MRKLSLKEMKPLPKDRESKQWHWDLTLDSLALGSVLLVTIPYYLHHLIGFFLGSILLCIFILALNVFHYTVFPV